MNEIIKNENLSVAINLKGALLEEILDLKNDNFNLLYEVEEGSWPFKDVQIFPLIGKGEFKFENRDYYLKARHGFLRNSDFEIIDKKEDLITLGFHSNRESFDEYPFHFSIYITYSLENYTLKVNTKVVSDNDEQEIYFAYGSHTGLKAKENVSKLTFDSDLVINPLIKENGLIDLNQFLDLQTNELVLTKDLFKEYDTIVMKNNYKKITLDNGFGYNVTYDFTNALFLAVWSNPNKGNFVCVEPWWGISNYTNDLHHISDIKYINVVKKEKEFNYSFTFTRIN